jgi:hypothetical protein
VPKIDFSNKIYPSITGETGEKWRNKLNEINELKLEEVAVFLSWFDKRERSYFYKFLLKSSIKKIPLVHLRDDTDDSDIEFFTENFGTEYFNIHESFFRVLNQWKDYRDKLYLELNYNNEIPKDVDIKKIGGFCIDFSHLKSAIARGTKEAYYILSRKNKIKFICNHVNGYDFTERSCKHTITGLKDFDYLTTLPKYVFGEVIALEVYNTIKEQLEFKKYLIKLLNNYFENE